MTNTSINVKKDFFTISINRILKDKKSVIDIGGGLRALPDKGNRHDTTQQWLVPLLEKIDYKILDPVNTYNPDIVGDIHDLPFEDNSQEAIICIAVLEHVENPIKACEEMYRVLKPGGYCFVYVPFLYYYHAEKGYYGDYWRFTKDTISMLFKNFSSVESHPLHGAIETWVKISPLGNIHFLRWIAVKLDSLLGKNQSNQVSGFNIFLVK
ncbi:class I SAM-dependent methyltransferase [Candidatus Parcubacteria bacterium]|nr:class I SAM-dependent methyltransferase [Candidatus Parcubacteria bacterium]